MKTTMKLLTAVAVIGLSGSVLAQTPQEHQQHHPGAQGVQAQTTPPQTPAPAQSQTQPPPPSQSTPQSFMGQMMQGMPEQCRATMQSMPQNCMNMMEQMMQDRMRQGGIGQGGMMGGGMNRGGMMGGMGQGRMMREMPGQSAATSEATKAYLEAVDKSYGPLLEGLQASDPDVAFVRALIANKQGAIAIANVRQQYGKDAQTKTWAENIIREQERDIGEMEAWLKKQAK